MSTIIKPSIGRVVWFYAATAIYEASKVDAAVQPHAALVTYVHSDRLVNLAVFDPAGVQYKMTSVTLVQDGDAEPTGAHARWMPYQLGQAAKAEKIEAETKIGTAEPVLPPHQQRVVQEKHELDEKLGKLDTFIASGTVFLTLAAAEQERLTRQFRYMEAYSKVLGERIAAF